MKQGFYGIILSSSEENSDTTRIFFWGIVALLVFAYIRAYTKNKKRYDKMMSSVMASSGNDYPAGGTGNTYSWQNSVDAATLNEYRKDYIRLKIHNVWDVIKIFIVSFLIGIPVIWLIRKDATIDSVQSFLNGFFLPIMVVFLLIVIIHLRAQSFAMIRDDSVVYRRLVPLMIRILMLFDNYD